MKDENENTVALAYWNKSFLPKRCHFCGRKIPRKQNHVIIDWYCIVEEHYCDSHCAREQVKLDRDKNKSKYRDNLNEIIFGE